MRTKAARSRLLLLALIIMLSGCETATRFVFSPGKELSASFETPAFQYQDVWFEAFDKTRLHGWWIPGDPSAPLVLFFHGNAANISHRVPNLEYLHQLGLNLFIFDYRGFGKSEGVPLREEDLYQDARGALRWLQNNSWKPEQLIYFGRSMGATVALQMALERPPGGVVLECSFTSLPDIAIRTNPLSFGLMGRWLIKDRFDNEKKIPSLQVPLLLLHGREDKIVPYTMSEKLFSLAREPKTFQLIEGAGHSDCYLVGGELYRNAWVDFINDTARQGVVESQYPEKAAERATRPAKQPTS